MQCSHLKPQFLPTIDLVDDLGRRYNSLRYSLLCHILFVV